MNPRKLNNLLRQTTDELSASNSLHGLFHEHRDGDPLPSGPVLAEIIDLCRAIIFPGFYGNSTLSSETLPYHIGVNVEQLFILLTEQIMAGMAFGEDISNGTSTVNEQHKQVKEKAEAKAAASVTLTRSKAIFLSAKCCCIVTSNICAKNVLILAKI